MAKVGFKLLGFGAEDTGVATGSGEREGAATGAGSGWAVGSGGAAGTCSSIRLFFLHPPLKGWQGEMPERVWPPSSRSIPHEVAGFCWSCSGYRTGWPDSRRKAGRIPMRGPSVRGSDP